MNVFHLFRKKPTEEPISASSDVETSTSVSSTPIETEVKMNVNVQTEKDAEKGEKAFGDVAPKNVGKLDMVIAFDTTGSMAQYIGAVRKEVSDLIP